MPSTDSSATPNQPPYQAVAARREQVGTAAMTSAMAIALALGKQHHRGNRWENGRSVAIYVIEWRDGQGWRGLPWEVEQAEIRNRVALPYSGLVVRTDSEGQRISITKPNGEYLVKWSSQGGFVVNEALRYDTGDSWWWVDHLQALNDRYVKPMAARYARPS